MRPLDELWATDTPMGSCAFWLQRAEEARIAREAMHDKACRAMMLNVIACYEGLAETAIIVNASASAIRASSSRFLR